MMTIALDAEYVAELTDDQVRRAFAHSAALRVLATALVLLQQGLGWGRTKVAIATLARAQGLTTEALARLLVHWQAAGLVQLARADLPTHAYGPLATDVVDSGVVLAGGGGQYHFVVVPLH
jgi:hypothetical protein